MTSIPEAPRTRLGEVGFSEVLSALSHALDLTEGQPPGHTIRSCIIGMRIADQVGLDPESRSALYYTLLLKDAGCSSNAARMAAMFGADDQAVKPRMKVVDWHKRAWRQHSQSARLPRCHGRRGRSRRARRRAVSGSQRAGDLRNSLDGTTPASSRSCNS